MVRRPVFIVRWDNILKGTIRREVAIHRVVVREVPLQVGMVEVPWNGLRSVPFAVGVIGALDFVAGLGNARVNSARDLAG
jgi:hypothetical protein